MQIQVNTGKAELLFVKVPDNTNRHSYDKYRNLISADEDEDPFSPVDWFSDKLPIDNWQIIGLAHELTNAQCENLVEIYPDFSLQKVTYKCYTKKNAVYLYAKESFESLMEANEIYSVNPFQEPDRGDYSGGDQFWFDFDQWQKAKERTGKYIVLKQITEKK